MKIKSKGKSGTRSICICQNCGEEFSELNTKIRAGGGKFCCNDCYKEFRSKNKCAICGDSFDETKAFVDHDHQSGKVRGLLRTRCDTLLGMAKDNVEILKSAIKYLSV